MFLGNRQYVPHPHLKKKGAERENEKEMQTDGQTTRQTVESGDRFG